MRAQYLSSAPTATSGDIELVRMDADRHLIVTTENLPAALGQATMANSLPVAIASNQSSIPVVASKPSRVARAVFMASAALPASGAYTSTTAYSIPDGVQFVTFYVTYTRGAAGGFAKFKCTVGNGTETAVIQTVDPNITVSQPSGLQLSYNSELNGPKPQDANPLVFAFTFATRAGETTIALQAAELGITATPGTCAIALTAGY